MTHSDAALPASAGLGADAAMPSFAQLFDAAPALISVHAGPDHTYVYLNAGYRAAVGGRDLTGLSIRDALPDLADQDVFERYDATYRDGTSLHVAELAVKPGDGADPSAQQYYRQVLQPWYDDTQQIAGIMCFAYDITDQVLARQRAEASERHLAYALEVGESVGIFHWDARRDVVVPDAQVVRTLGLDATVAGQEIPLGDLLGTVVASDRDRVKTAIRDAMDHGTDLAAEFRTCDGAGTTRHVLARGRCLRNGAGQPSHLTGIIVDLTEQRFREQALRESEATLRSVFSSIDQGYALAEMVLDDDGQSVDYRFLEVNSLFEEMTGLKSAEGQTARTLVPGLEQHWIDIYARVAMDGEHMRFEESSEVMKRQFDVFAMPVLPKGRFVIVFKDVTAERQIAKSYLVSEAEFRTMTEAMPQMVWATQPDGHHDFFNARWYEFTGVPAGSTDGVGWKDIFHPDDQPEAWIRWRHALDTGTLYEIEYRLRHVSGTYRWVLGRAQPVRDPEGQIIRWLGTCTDIHAIKMAEEQRKLLLGEMNHRVKNTLAMAHAIVSQTLRRAETLQDASILIEQRIGMMAKAHDRLINATWTEARIADVIDAALEPHRTAEGRFAIDGPDVPIGSKQALALTMALHELATNAAKYGALSREGGRIRVAWRFAPDNPDAAFHLSWQESGGPAVTPPLRRGFGSRMIEQALAGYFHGQAELRYDPDGLSFELTAPAGGLLQ